MPKERAGVGHVYHLYVVACAERDNLMAYLADRRIGCAIHYPVPVHRQNGYTERAIVPSDGLPVTEQLCGQILSLPLYPELSDAEVDRVIDAVRCFFRR